MSLMEILGKAWGRRKELSLVTLVSYCTLLVNFLTQVVLARMLGPEDYGAYISALAMVALVEVPIINRGNEIALRQIGKLKTKPDLNVRQMIWQIFKNDTLLITLAFTAYVMCSQWMSELVGVDFYFFLILTLILPAQIGFGIAKSCFVIFDLIPLLVKYEILFSIIKITILVASYLMGDVYGLAVGYVITVAVKTVLAFLFVRKYIPNEQGQRQEGRSMKSELKDSLFSLSRGTLSNGVNQIDTLLLSIFFNSQGVGIYKVAKSLSSLPTKVSFPVWRYLQPKILNCTMREDHVGFRKLVLVGVLILGSVFGMMLPLVYFFGENLIVLLYGQEYLGSYVPFLILLIGIWAFNGMTGWFKIWAVVSKSQTVGLVSYVFLFFSMLFIGLNYGTRGSFEMAIGVSSTYIMFSVLITVYMIFAGKSVHRTLSSDNKL